MRDGPWMARFHREAKAVARFSHPHIVTIYEVGEVDGRLFIAMELIDGPGLDDLISERGRLPWDETLEILTRVAEALDYAHAEGVIHRDLKPSNILIDGRHGPVLTDFGFARVIGESSMSMSLSGGVVGTPAYIAPEVWRDDDPGPQADVYALGCIAYEMATGERLYAGKTPAAVMAKHLDYVRLPPWSEWVSRGTARVLSRALALQPASRYESAGAFAAALQEQAEAAAQSREAGKGGRRENDAVVQAGLGWNTTTLLDVAFPRLAQRLSRPARTVVLAVLGGLAVGLAVLLVFLAIDAYQATFDRSALPSRSSVVVAVLRDSLAVVVCIAVPVMAAVGIIVLNRMLRIIGGARRRGKSFAADAGAMVGPERNQCRPARRLVTA